mmetsp:Transcript_4511/g.13266  ORF Transcript_4511/g.13266 Transcript_4511/m.13266 type:complete len:403 (-) Transcript_4511:192-1400(-)
MGSGGPASPAASNPRSLSSPRPGPRSKRSTRPAPSTSTATRPLRGQTASCRTCCRGAPGCNSGRHTAREVGSGPHPAAPSSKSRGPALPSSALPHQASAADGPAARRTCSATSQRRGSQRRTRGSRPAWATASSVPSGAQRTEATGPPRQRRSVARGACPAGRCGQTRTAPRGPAAARQRPSGDQSKAGHAKASPRRDQAQRQQSPWDCRQITRPEDMPTAIAALLGCQAKLSAVPGPSSCKYSVVAPEPSACTANWPPEERLASSSLCGCHARHTADAARSGSGCRPETVLQASLRKRESASRATCSSEAQRGPGCPASAPSKRPALPHRCRSPSTLPPRIAAGQWTAVCVTCRHCLNAEVAGRFSAGSGANNQHRLARCASQPPAKPGASLVTNSPSARS